MPLSKNKNFLIFESGQYVFIYYFTKYTFQFEVWFFDVYNLVYAKNDKKKIGIGIIVGVVLYALIMLFM